MGRGRAGYKDPPRKTAPVVLYDAEGKVIADGLSGAAWRQYHQPAQVVGSAWRRARIKLAAENYRLLRREAPRG